MKLRLLNPTHRLAIDTLALARRLRVTTNVENKPGRSDKLVVVANGSPDNRVILALAHILNGDVVVDIVFPERKHLAVIELLSEYTSLGYERILVVLDQESMSLEEIHKSIRSRLSGYIEVREGGRLVVVKQSPSKPATIAIAISGLDDDRFKKHTIEDHLLRLAEDLGVVSLPRIVEDPKRLWESKNIKDKHHQVYEAIIQRRSKIERVFPQHIVAFKELIEGRDPAL